MAKRSIIYVDGFNLYYGALKNTAYRWLNLDRYFALVRPHDTIQKIRYFTALVNGPKRPKQETYLRALETRPLIEITLGKFKAKWARCGVTSCTFSGNRSFSLWEEKRTDVSIAVQMLNDAYRQRCDCLVLVSGDSDLVPAVATTKACFPEKEIVVYIPARHPGRGAALELRSVADKARELPLNVLRHAQFPAKVLDGTGGLLTKPSSW